MEIVKLGLIGLGYIGKAHLRCSLKLDSATLVAVSDISKKALRFARRMGIKKTYTDYRMLLDDNDIDAVIIALPTYLHFVCAVEAAEAGKHILLEKPLARNVAEGKQLISTVRANRVKLMVGYPFRFSPHFKAIKNKIESGELGEIQIAHATYISSGPFFHRSEEGVPRPVPDWWFNKKLTGGGVLLDLGVHLINLTRWYFGEIKNIKTYLGFRFNFDFEDHAICIADFTSGTKTIINVGWFTQNPVLRVELFGTAGYTYASPRPSHIVKRMIQLLLRRIPQSRQPLLAELQHFVNSIKENKRPSPSGEDALEDLKVIEYAYKNSSPLD